MSMPTPFHVRLLNLMGAIRDISPFNALSAEEEDLLRDLIVRWHATEAVTISDIMRTMAGVSQSTAYRRLISMRDKGMVQLRVDTTDRRTKFVEPTVLAHDYARRIDLALAHIVLEMKNA